MKNAVLAAIGSAAVLFAGLGLSAPAAAQDPEKKFPDFNTVVKGAKEHDGLFKLYHKDDHVYCEIRPDQMNQPWLCSISVARGGGMGGHMLNFEEDWVLYFKRVGDRIFLVRRNVHFKANPGSPVSHAVETTYTDSVLMALRIATINQMRNAPLVNLNDIFLTDFAQLGLGFFDANRSTWHKVKTFPKNCELQVAATFAGGGRRFGGFGSDGTIDPRGNTVVVHYGMVQLPDYGYQPRLGDDRVGYFLSAVKDFSSDNKDTSFIRYVRRWRLERAEPPDPKHPNKLSAPKKKIVFWIEKSVPDEYRAYVREGILEWNKAFEKIGFRDAIEVRQQEDDAAGDFDPEDIRYNTFRWITTDLGFAMGPSRANPLTGELIDADIIFDASMVRFWKQPHLQLTAHGVEMMPASPVRQAQLGLDLLQHPLLQRQASADGWNDRGEAASLYEMRMRAIQKGYCQCCSEMKYELGLTAMALAARGEIKPGEKVPEELIGQAIKEVTMHEVGHTLGLRHNFKASTMLKNEQLHDTSITRKQGLVGSVMDYSPANIALKGTKQGDYFTTTIGPYDYWAIEYAYKPLSGGTEGEWSELQKIASRSAAAGNDYGTDEDVFLTSDPLINRWDLGADPMKFAQDRIKIAEELLKDLADRVVDKGEGYQRARVAFGLALSQYGNGAHFISNYIGAEYAHRDHKGDPNGRDPLLPVKAAKQREALKFLQENVLTDKPFQFSPALLRKLAVERWMHWSSREPHTDYPLHDRILGIQQVVLDRVFDSSVLQRIQNNSLKADKDEQPLTLAEVFRTTTDGVWSDLGNGPGKDGKRAVASSIIRRNLQREHLKNLYTLMLGEKSGGGSFLISFGGGGGSAPPDARSLARYHLRDINKRIDTVLTDKQAMLDETTRAHLEECHERIGKVLTASMQINEP
ncbi:MAG TPA: zinc-dependent metalloprotease [Gemmataceae bacterium]|nr:zinc-dependent metalloprotease [Gemmataceae bacterium]